MRIAGAKVMTPIYRHEAPEPDAEEYTYIDLGLFERYDAKSEASARRMLGSQAVSFRRNGRIGISKSIAWQAEAAAIYVNNSAKTVVLVPDTDGLKVGKDKKGMRAINTRHITKIIFERLKMPEEIGTLIYTTEQDEEGRLICRFQRASKGTGR